MVSQNLFAVQRALLAAIPRPHPKTAFSLKTHTSFPMKAKAFDPMIEMWRMLTNTGHDKDFWKH